MPILVNGKVVASYDGNQSPTTNLGSTFTIAATGWYDIQIIYWDQGGQAAFQPSLGLVTGTGSVSYLSLEHYGLVHGYSFVTSEEELILISKKN